MRFNVLLDGQGVAVLSHQWLIARCLVTQLNLHLPDLGVACDYILLKEQFQAIEKGNQISDSFGAFFR